MRDQPEKDYAFGDAYHVWNFRDYYILLRPYERLFEVAVKKRLTSDFSLVRWYAENAAGVNYLLQRAAATIDRHSFGKVHAYHAPGPFQNDNKFIENLIHFAPLEKDYRIRIEPIELSMSSMYAAKQLQMNLAS